MEAMAEGETRARLWRVNQVVAYTKLVVCTPTAHCEGSKYLHTLG